MGTQIYLGMPPPHIKKWIEGHTVPVAPKGKVLYRTTAGGDWLEDDADITDGTFNGFANKTNAVEVIIPSKDANGNAVTSIEKSAFADCSRLTSVTIPDSVTSIGDGAFHSCGGLTSVTIPGSVTSIGDSVFFDCYRLTSIEFKGNAPIVGVYAFDAVASGCKAVISPTATGFPEPGETWNGLIVEVKP